MNELLKIHNELCDVLDRTSNDLKIVFLRSRIIIIQDKIFKMLEEEGDQHADMHQTEV